MAKLYVVPTPLGNFEDMTLRAIRILKECSIILCEDTRTASILLRHFDIDKRLISYHMHNENKRSEEILSEFEGEGDIALISDAGMPGISDPGHVLIKKAIENNWEVNVLPGASASITALVGSGLDTSSFIFIGFLDKNRSARKKQLLKLTEETRTMIFYEAPHRIKEFLNLFLDVFGNRKISLCRELTKIYEEYERGTIEEIIEIYSTKEPRGEYVIVLEGKDIELIRQEKLEEISKIPIETAVKDLMNEGKSKMEAVKIVAKERGLKKNDVYMKVVDL